MKLSRQDLLALLILLAVLIANAVGLSPELSISRVDLNDNVYHFTLCERMVQALDRGENPLDCWSSEWSMGYPVLRIYQPLAHMIVVGIFLLLGKSVSLMTVFVWVRFFSQVLLPLTFFAAARLMGLPRLTAAAAALLAPMISTNFLYGVEYGSYTWAGSGLFPQAVASHFLLLSLGLAVAAIRQGRRLVLTGIMAGLAFLCHSIYGYMAGLSVLLLAVLPDAIPRWDRFRRVVVVGAVALLLAAFQLVPLLTDGAVINHSRWEAVWKWNSFGAGDVLTKLFTGELLDHGRVPVLTALAFLAVGLWIWNWRKGRPTDAIQGYLLLGTAFWTLVFFGRDFWGPLLTLLGVSPDMHLHRVIAGAQIFLVLLAATALARLWSAMSRRWSPAIAAIVTAILLVPMVRDRATNLSNNARWGRNNLIAYDKVKDDISSVIALAQRNGGRVYAGLAAGWGGKFRVGEVPFYAFLSEANVPALSFLYHSMALTGETMVKFNEWNPAHYLLFNIHTVIAPPGTALPPFLQPITQIGQFGVYNSLGGNYFEVVDALSSVKTTKNNFYDINDRWLASDWVLKRIHLYLDWRGDAPKWIPRIAPEDQLPKMPMLNFPGEVTNEVRTGENYQADIDARRICYALLKMTWHPNWKAYVDGKPVETVMLSPGFIGVPLGAGHHHIFCRYESGNLKSSLAIVGLIGVALFALGERRGLAHSLKRFPAPALRRPVLVTCGLLLLAAPVAIPLLTSSVLWGHDGFVYFPRLEEVHQGLIHGALIPRWAPDLGNGTGQPLFLFNPPIVYYLGEFWHLLGFDFVTAMNLACLLIVLASAAAMYALARLYFGELGGWLGAAAFLYAPYFAVDLYVRSVMAEFAAFPFAVLAFYGFGAYAKYRRRRDWLVGVFAYAGLLLSHFPAALLFTPLLICFLALTAWMERSRAVAIRQALGFGVSLALSAFIWFPGLALREYASIAKQGQGYLAYSNHFVYLNQLFYSPWGYGLSVPGPNDGMSFSLGWSHLLLVAIAWIWIARRPSLGDGRLIRFFGIAGILLALLTLQDAVWIWEQLPLLQSVEFPWRLLGPVTLCFAMVVAQLGKILESIPRWRAAGLAAALALLIAPNLGHMHTKQPWDVDLAFWTPEQLSIRGFETTSAGECTPKWMVAAPKYTPAAATVLSGDAEIQSSARVPLHWTSGIKARTPATIEMRTAYFPGWQVRVDGRPVDAGPGPLTGLITFQVPAGDHTVEVYYGRTTPEKLAAGVSIAALAGALALAFVLL